MMHTLRWLRAVARKELTYQLLGTRFWAGALLAIVLAASATQVTARDYAQRLARYRNRQALQQQSLRRVSVYSALQPLAARPPALLSIMNQGPDTRLGTEVRIDLFTVPFWATGEEQGNEFLILLPVMDLTHVVSLVLGMLALLLTCDALTCEREDGTLAAILAVPVPLRTAMAGKLLGNLAAILMPLGAALLVSLLILHRAAPGSLDADAWWRIGGLAAAYALYLGSMLLLGMLISFRAGSSARALGVSVLVWFVLAILIPEGAWAVADAAPGASRVHRSTEVAVERLTAAYERAMERHFQQSPLRAVPSGFTARDFATGVGHEVRYGEGAAPYYDALAEHYRFAVASGMATAQQVYELRQRYERALAGAERRGALLAALSPTTLLYRVADSLSNTSVDELDRFLAACRAYRLRLIAYLDARHAFAAWRWFTDDPPDRLHPWPVYFGLTPEQVGPQQMHLFSRLAEPAVEAAATRYRAAVEDDPTRRLPLADLPAFDYRASRMLACCRRSLPEVALLLAAALAGVAALASLTAPRTAP